MSELTRRKFVVGTVGGLAAAATSGTAQARDGESNQILNKIAEVWDERLKFLKGAIASSLMEGVVDVHREDRGCCTSFRVSYRYEAPDKARNDMVSRGYESTFIYQGGTIIADEGRGCPAPPFRDLAITNYQLARAYDSHPTLCYLTLPLLGILGADEKDRWSKAKAIAFEDNVYVRWPLSRVCLDSKNLAPVSVEYLTERGDIMEQFFVRETKVVEGLPLVSRAVGTVEITTEKEEGGPYVFMFFLTRCELNVKFAPDVFKDPHLRVL